MSLGAFIFNKYLGKSNAASLQKGIQETGRTDLCQPPQLVRQGPKHKTPHISPLPIQGSFFISNKIGHTFEIVATRCQNCKSRERRRRRRRKWKRRKTTMQVESSQRAPELNAPSSTDPRKPAPSSVFPVFH